ncbi:MAG: aldehyde dehydrogenase family protein [Candidatus Niyogibacteria bacterium]|nr:aldehyde dehydrogenase family protein [Candidatus Niyogibacteria bacterium]
MTSHYNGPSVNYIDGEWVSGGTQLFKTTNPANPDEIIGIFPESTPEHLDRAIAAAKKAFPAWNDLGLVKRSEYLWRFAKLIEEEFGSLAPMVTMESGKQVNEAQADVAETLHMCQYAFAKGFIGEAGTVFADEIAEKLCSEEYRARGIAVCITPWNFPMAIPLWEIGLTLIYGNVVILKPSEETPYCAHRLAQLIERAKFPAGVFQLLHGQGEGIGNMLVNHPDVNVVLFTGSYDVGAELKKQVACFPNKFFTMETGSKSAVIVADDADMDNLAIPASLASAWKTAGQRCVSGSRMIVHRSRIQEFADKFAHFSRRIRVGDPTDPHTFYGPMINRAGVEKGLWFNARAKQEGFTILLDRNNEAPPTPNGHWLYPFVYTGEWRSDSSVLRNEAFSPHVAIIPADSIEDAVRIYNDTPYGLSVAVITEDFRKARYVETHAEAGMIYHDLPCIGAGVRMAFGGVKASGNLIPSAAGILPAITHRVAITRNYARKIAMAQGLDISVQ